MTIKLWLSKVTLGQSFKKEEIIKMVISNTIKGKSSFHFVVSYIIQYCATKTSYLKIPRGNKAASLQYSVASNSKWTNSNCAGRSCNICSRREWPHNFYDECFQIKHTKWISKQGLCRSRRGAPSPNLRIFLREIGTFLTFS